MEAVLERRVASVPRVRLDALVELSHEGFEETFEADAVNVGVGGLSMRATYLPDVGERLTCRFPIPGVSGVVETGAEVVWCEDTGPHTGEFGLRFVGLDPIAERALKLVVLGRESYTPPAPSEAAQSRLGAPEGSPEDTHDEAPCAEEVVLAIDGVRSPIRAGLVDGDDDVMSLAQELPFLRLKTGVTVQKDGRRGRIEAIDLIVEGDLPKLLIDIVFDERDVERAFAVHATEPAADETLPDFLPPKVPANDTAVDVLAPDLNVGAARDEGTATSKPARHAGQPSRTVDVIRPPSATPSPAVFDDDDDDDGHDEHGGHGAVHGGRDDVRVFALDVHRDATPTGEPHESEHAADQADAPDAFFGRDILTVLRARAALFAVHARARAMPLLLRVLPALAAIAKRVRPFATVLVARTRPFLEAAAERVARFGRTARVFVGERFPRLAQKSVKRRTTTAPPGDSNVAARRRAPRAVKPAPDAPRTKHNRRRTILLSIIALAAIALLVYVFTSDDEPAVDGSAQSIADRVVAEPAASGADPNGAATDVAAAEPVHTSATAPTFPPSGSTTTTPPAPAAPSVVQPAMPRALAPTTLQAGPMPAPTFPSLREGAQPAPPSVLPEGSPYAVDVRQGEGVGTGTTSLTSAAPTAGAAGATEFGAANVPDGRSYLIRMSQPVHAISGTARPDGFTIVVANALSLDRAGPIAATHPLVERSMILNRGDHSELTIAFVEGRTPTYAVRARGSAIEVVIGRR